MPQTTLQADLWEKAKDELRLVFSDDIFEMWFAPLKHLETQDDTLVLSAPNEFAAIWIEDNYMDILRQKVRLVTGQPFKISVRVRHDEPMATPAGAGLPSSRISGQVLPTERNTAANRSGDNRYNGAETPRRDIILNPRNTFENYIVGSSNQLAHAACHAVAHSPAKSYNPLFLNGETGLGKTHLMQAVAHYILSQNKTANVVYISCEKFTNEFIRAIQENTLIQFRRTYRNVDVLLIDDIQFLAGKERIQEEFFHTFNELYEAQRQICLSSDRPVSEISKLESRLVSRFQWGMVADIQAPDLETRVAILRKKAEALGHSLPESVLEFMAERITRNVRRMEGALTRVASYSTLTQKELDISTVERLLHDILQEEAQNQITIEKIQKKVVDNYNLRLSDMVSKRRPANIAFPRQVAMYLSRILTNHSLQEIGECFGGRDHGTVIHACKAVENMMDQDENVRRTIDYLNKQLSGRA